MTIIDQFMELTEGMPVPELFRKWSAITMVAGVLERRVWIDIGVKPIYPNLYVLLLAHPGTGKSIPIDLVRTIWREVGQDKLFVAPDSITKASFLDQLARAVRTMKQDGRTVQYHCLLVASPEFGNFMPEHDTEFLNTLNTIYDAGSRYEETRRHAPSVSIPNPCVTILAGTQPDFLSALLPKEAWGMGFTSRLIFVYSNERQKVKLMREGRKATTKVDEIVEQTRPLLDLVGQFTWDDAAWSRFSRWYYDEDEAPIPDHPRLRHYNTRRAQTVCKLAQVFAVAERPETHIEAHHIEAALETLFEVEREMPRIFEEMGSSSDQGDLEDVVYWIAQAYLEGGRQPLKTPDVSTVIQRKFRIADAPRVLDYLKAAGYIKMRGNTIIPTAFLKEDKE